MRSCLCNGIGFRWLATEELFVFITGAAAINPDQMYGTHKNGFKKAYIFRKLLVACY